MCESTIAIGDALAGTFRWALQHIRLPLETYIALFADEGTPRWHR